MDIQGVPRALGHDMVSLLLGSIFYSLDEKSGLCFIDMCALKFPKPPNKERAKNPGVLRWKGLWPQCLPNPDHLSHLNNILNIGFS